jgi:hypothetical protein
MTTVSTPSAKMKATRVLTHVERKAKEANTKAFRGIVDTVVSGLLAFHKTGDDAPEVGADVETYAKLATGTAIRAGDSVAVIPFAGTYLILGLLSSLEEGMLAESPIASMSPTPSVSVGAAAGGGATVSLRNSSNDDFGTVVLVTGTSPTSGTLLTITFGRPKRNADYAALWSPGDADAATAMTKVNTPYISGRSTTSVILLAESALPAGTSHIWYYSFLTPVLG